MRGVTIEKLIDIEGRLKEAMNCLLEAADL